MEVPQPTDRPPSGECGESLTRTHHPSWLNDARTRRNNIEMASAANLIEIAAASRPASPPSLPSASLGPLLSLPQTRFLILKLASVINRFAFILGHCHYGGIRRGENEMFVSLPPKKDSKHKQVGAVVESITFMAI